MIINIYARILISILLTERVKRMSLLYPHQFHDIEHRVARLINVYKSVNDTRTISLIQSETQDHILSLFPKKTLELEKWVDQLMTLDLSTYKAEKLLAEMKPYVKPFTHPSPQQVKKVFRKVKKLKTPKISDEVLYDSTYIGWTDIASQRKYIIYYDKNGKLQGFYGDISPQVVKGFCSICNKESNVSLFMRKTDQSSDGRYTKKGDYICHDSLKCNRQLDSLVHFQNFLHKIQ